jgi:hypothetical protein
MDVVCDKMTDVRKGMLYDKWWIKNFSVHFSYTWSIFEKSQANFWEINDFLKGWNIHRN